MSRPRQRSRAVLRRENRTRDAFLLRVSQGLSARVRALEEAPAALDAIKSFARELSIIAGDRQALIPRRAPLDVGLHIQEIIEDWRRQHGERASAQPTLHLERTGSLLASVDAEHITSILAELVSNAAKYGGGRPIRVLVDGEQTFLQIIVEDEGSGFVPTSALGRRFARGPGSERAPGFGVGLWLTQTLAAAHGGALRFSPRPGGGTRAVVTLLREG